MNKTRNETRDKTTSETCKRKIKSIPEPTNYIRSMWQIIILAPSEPLHSAEEKKYSHCHRPQ
jgi:hypothetical protein